MNKVKQKAEKGKILQVGENAKARVSMGRAERKIATNNEQDLDIMDETVNGRIVNMHTDQRKSDSLLKEYINLFEYSPTGYFVLNTDGIIENVNIRGCEQLGMEKSSLIGELFSTFINLETDMSNFLEHRKFILENEKLHQMECRIRHTSGSNFFGLIKSVIIRNENDQLSHLLSVVSDISDIKEKERLVEQNLIKEMEINLMKSRFIAMASHEFRTPLSAILSSTSLVEEYSKLGMEDKMKKHFKRIKSSVSELTTILDDFLSLEKLESGKVEVERRNFDFPEFCEDLIEEVGAVLKTGQQITYQHIGERDLNEDHKLLRHILVNLLSNACKYSGDGTEIKLKTEVKGSKVILEIIDQGIGIPDDEQKNLFNRFFRARNAVTVQGTGLGLNIVKRYVDLLNGIIKFTSKENKGTTFIVEFPRVKAV